MTTNLLVATPSGSAWPIFLASGCALAGAAGMLSALRRIRGTTLIGPWVWSLAALLAVAAGQVVTVLTSDETGQKTPLQFICAVATLLPAVAVVGAKRPQHRAWPWIVLSLWAILSAPAFHAALFASSAPLTLHPAQSWFLLVLMLLGPLNYLATRRGVLSLVVLVGQYLLLSPYLPLVARDSSPATSQIALALLTVGVVLACVAWPHRQPRRHRLARVWTDFHNSFGAMWSLRVAERVNVTAERGDWPVRLYLSGFRSTSDAPPAALDQLPPATLAAIESCLRSLLMRFVSDRWLAERW